MGSTSVCAVPCPWKSVDSIHDHDLPQVVPLAEHHIPLGVEHVPHLPQPALTAAALQAILVPVITQGLKQ